MAGERSGHIMGPLRKSIFFFISRTFFFFFFGKKDDVVAGGGGHFNFFWLPIMQFNL